MELRSYVTGNPNGSATARSEAEIESVADQLARFGELGFVTHVADPGRHGSSMLNPDRVEGDVEPTWEVVLEFLGRVTAVRPGGG